MKITPGETQNFRLRLLEPCTIDKQGGHDVVQVNEISGRWIRRGIERGHTMTEWLMYYRNFQFDFKHGRLNWSPKTDKILRIKDGIYTTYPKPECIWEAFSLGEHTTVFQATVYAILQILRVSHRGGSKSRFWERSGMYFGGGAWSSSSKLSRLHQMFLHFFNCFFLRGVLTPWPWISSCGFTYNMEDPQTSA